MHASKVVTITSGKKEYVLDATRVLYVQMKRNDAFVHMIDGELYDIRVTLRELREILGSGFLLVHRSCLVSARAIHDITDTVNLINGESLEYTVRRKRQLREELQAWRASVIEDREQRDASAALEDYHARYASFDDMPFAFTDIEMVLDGQRQAVDWVFRYGNDALARLEKVPLDRLIGHSFGSIFPNMDGKWLRCYERAAFWGETLELIDYSPEIDTYLKVVCFPTITGHCGCILFDIQNINYTRSSPDADRALALYFGYEGAADR
ncbi:LytTR family transcriptional regulator DNA-binding domain-containing protein [Parafannyhessea umbonata]|uniref:LytTR family transcriptional regulator DNA-binding domain-containing protein n=1 Tax=Parafannyhessea umbonata TaxID=604330 RepID=UPI00359CAD70